MIEGYDPKDYKGWEDIPDVEPEDALMERAKEVYALRAELRALKSAAWDVHEVIGDALDGEVDIDDIRKAWNELGELLPAQRPTDREEVKP